MTEPYPWPADATRRVPTSSLRASDRNARVHGDAQIALIASAITRWGWTIPVLIDEGNQIIAGHARVMAAKSLGMEEVPVMTAVGWSDAQKRAYMIADNKLALNASWDEDMLRAELSDLISVGEDAALVGFDAAELDALFPSPATGGVDDDDARTEDVLPDIPPPVTRAGDVWQMGAHRLACGDAADRDIVDRLLDGCRVALLLTSPPYGQQRDYTGAGMSDWDAMMAGVFGSLDRIMHAHGQVLVNLGLVHRAGEVVTYWDAWIRWMSETGWRRFGWYVWDQGPGLPGDWNGRLAPSFEFIFHFNRAARQANKIIPCRWAGQIASEKGGLRGKDGTVGEWTHAGQGVQDMRIPDNVIRITRHKARGIETEHPAVFPVKLPEFLMQTYTDADDIVFEPFSGSGTTLLAGQSTGRVVRAVDLAPEYVDLAIARWVLCYPNIPVLDAVSARTYAEVAADRSRIVRASSRKRRDK